MLCLPSGTVFIRCVCVVYYMCKLTAGLIKVPDWEKNGKAENADNFPTAIAYYRADCGEGLFYHKLFLYIFGAVFGFDATRLRKSKTYKMSRKNVVVTIKITYLKHLSKRAVIQ